MIDPRNSRTVNDGSLWSTIMLLTTGFFFNCEEEVIIGDVDEDSSFPIIVIGGILIGTLIILSFGGFA